MELEQIVENFAKSLVVVDETTEIQRTSRSGSGDYIPCVATMWEDDFTREAVITWALRSPNDFENFSENGWKLIIRWAEENAIWFFLAKVSNLNFDLLRMNGQSKINTYVSLAIMAKTMIMESQKSFRHTGRIGAVFWMQSDYCPSTLQKKRP